MHLWSIDGGSICQKYICTFSDMWNLLGVMVLHAPMVNWLGGHLPLVYLCTVLCVQLMWFISYGYMCIVPCMKHIWCNGFAEIYAWLEEGVLICHGYILYIYISAMRCARFGVAVFKASPLKWGCQFVINPCYTITPTLPIDHRSMLHLYTP